jgi:O-antigen/teichoic acid export membrane protein
MEAYGLVGFYGTLIGSLSILDLGLSNTLSRELARSNSLSTPSSNIKSLVYSLEFIYWSMGFLIGILVVLLAPFIANHWVRAENLPTQTVEHSIMIMGCLIAFQWPQSLYNGGLMGLQKQVTFNLVTTILSTIKSVGVIFILKYITVSVIGFFIWQMVLTILTVLILKKLLWFYLPKSEIKARFSILEINNIKKFALGMTGISIATFCLSQVDKIVLSKILTLTDYGYYTLAWTVGTSVLMVVSIFGNTLFPKITEIVARNDKEEMIISFHRFNRLIVSAVAPIGLLLCVFSKEILYIWTGNIIISNTLWFAVTVLTAGSLCNSFMHIIYYKMLAHGITKFTFIQNVIATLILTPLLFWLTYRWSFNGATIVWFLLNLSYNIICIPLVCKLYFIDIKINDIYFKDIGIGLFISIIFIGFAKLMFINQDILPSIFFMSLGVLLSYFAIFFCSTDYKNYIISLHRKYIVYGK